MNSEKSEDKLKITNENRLKMKIRKSKISGREWLLKILNPRKTNGNLSELHEVPKRSADKRCQKSIHLTQPL